MHLGKHSTHTFTHKSTTRTIYTVRVLYRARHRSLENARATDFVKALLAPPHIPRCCNRSSERQHPQPRRHALLLPGRLLRASLLLPIPRVAAPAVEKAIALVEAQPLPVAPAEAGKAATAAAAKAPPHHPPRQRPADPALPQASVVLVALSTITYSFLSPSTCCVNSLHMRGSGHWRTSCRPPHPGMFTLWGGLTTIVKAYFC